MNKKFLSAIAGAAALALTLSACGASPEGEDVEKASGVESYITANGSEPENPLIPTATNETGGGKILTLLFSGLVYYDNQGKAHNDIAESITPNEDSSQFEVKIQKGLKFTDGTEVKADNFIKAWNDGAKLSNARLSSNFFEPIEGFSAEADSELTGLTKVDDYTFTIKLKDPTSDFAQRLGYSAFVPLPDAAFDENGVVTPEFGENPFGYGPYMLEKEGAWEHNVQITVKKNPDYKGPQEAQNNGVIVKFYTEQDAAYADLQADNLDVLDAIPDSAFGTFDADLSGRAQNTAVAIFQSFAIPDLPHLEVGTEEGNLRRQAISMAINRDEITKVVFQETRTPATDFSAPTIPGYSNELPGSEVLKYDAEKAKELWAQADNISKWEGAFKIAYNSDGGHQAWVDAVSNSIKNTLGIDAQGDPYPDFKSLRQKVNDRTLTTAFRTGWQADYPGINNFLAPLYSTNGGSNDTDYSNAEFDKLLIDANAQASEEAANKLYQQAEGMLFKDLPVIPLWYSNVVGGWSTKVENVTFDWHSVPTFFAITKK